LGYPGIFISIIFFASVPYPWGNSGNLRLPDGICPDRKPDYNEQSHYSWVYPASEMVQGRVCIQGVYHYAGSRDRYDHIAILLIFTELRDPSEESHLSRFGNYDYPAHGAHMGFSKQTSTTKVFTCGAGSLADIYLLLHPFGRCGIDCSGSTKSLVGYANAVEQDPIKT